MEKEVTYSYLNRHEVETTKFRTFIEKCHGQGSYEIRLQRMLWYWQLGDEGFRVLVAKRGDEYVGQSCAYRVLFRNNLKINELWWGVDAFVLSEMRGMGIGKKLQGELHKDVPNFSSAWYSPANGAIKRKCGGHGILTFPFAYYPVSSYVSILVELGIKKVFGTEKSYSRIRIPWLYYAINKIGSKSLKSFEVKEIALPVLPEFSSFAEECLADTSFHVIRSEEYLKWKYVNNPRTKCRALSVEKNGTQAGLVVFSELLEQDVVHARAKVIKIYDSLYKSNSGLSHKQLLLLVAAYLRKKGERVDGFKMLQKVDWHPALLYPKYRELLSTLDVDMMQNGYITYMDQDMEG